MCAARSDEKPNLILSIFQNKCPRCRRGKMYKYPNVYNLRNFMKMNERCPVCGQSLDMEPGFYYGTNMISYALAVLFSVATFILWWILIGFSLQDKRFFVWIGVNAVLLVLLQPPLCVFQEPYGLLSLFLIAGTGIKEIFLNRSG